MNHEMHDSLVQKSKSDTQYRDYGVSGVKVHDDGIELYMADSGFIYLTNLTDAPLPKKGDKVRFYGKGLGYQVRGIAKLSAHLGFVEYVYYYETEAEHQARHEREVAESKTKKQKDFAEKIGEFSTDVAKLPAAFQKRIEFFMRRQEWGPEFGPYELFSCKEAAKIARACKTPEQVATFAKPNLGSYKKDSEFQKLAVSDLEYEEHSGNTFGMACRLAFLYLKDPDLIPKEHGALCPLVGCQDYGCWAATEAAKAEKEA